MDSPSAPIQILSAAGFVRDLVYLLAPLAHTRRHWCLKARSTRPTQEFASPSRMLRPLPERRRGAWVPVPGLRGPARRGFAPILNCARRESADVVALILGTGPNRNRIERRE